jgi:hypothetical protein
MKSDNAAKLSAQACHCPEPAAANPAFATGVSTDLTKKKGPH